MTPVLLVLTIGLFAGGFYAFKTRRLASPRVWTGIAAGAVLGLCMALFSIDLNRSMIWELSFTFGVLGFVAGLLSDILVTDEKERAK